MFVPFDERSPSFLDPATVLCYGAIGRLQPGATAEQARAQLQAVARHVRQPDAASPGQHRVYVEDLREYFTGYNWRPLYFFLGASFLVLLLSIVNVATLLLSRGARRASEFAVRGALGGGCAALARQLLVEGLLLAVPAAVVGVLLATWAAGVFTAALPGDFLMRGGHIPIDVRVCVFSIVLTAVSAVLFVLAPLPLASRLGGPDALRSAGRTGHAPAEDRFRAGLLAAQIALTFILLAGAEHEGILYGVTITDPLMLGLALAGMLVVYLLAAARPAQQVTRVDPARALRAE